jgi:hypothetical protein
MGTKIHSEKSFGVLMAAISFAVSIFIFFSQGRVSFGLLILAAMLLSISFFKPSLLYIPNLWWFKLGKLLHLIMSPAIILAIFSLVVIPTGLLFRLFSYNPLRKKINQTNLTYWVDKSQKATSFENQF